MAGQTIQVSVLADTRKFKSAMSAVANDTGLSKFASGARSAMSKFGGAIKTGVKVVGGLAAMVTGLALKGGIKRALDIEDAKLSLEGLGHSTKSIDKIMGNALKSVRGTAYGLGDAATVAAGAVAAGITPGRKLTSTLKLTANTAAVAKTGLGEMGSILNKVWTSNKASTQELNQIADRGIPIWTKLAEHYKVNGTELRKMVSKGEVDAGTFAKVLKKTVGNSSETMGKGVRGMARNMVAALSRVGEGFVSKLMPHVKTGIQGATDLFDRLAPTVQAAGEAAGKWISNTLVPALKNLATWAGENLLPKIKKLGQWFTGTLIPAIKNLAGWISANLVPAFKTAGKIIGGAFTTAIKTVKDALGGTSTEAGNTAKSFGNHLVAAVETAGAVLGTLVKTGGKVIAWLIRNRELVKNVAIAFAGWKVIKAASSIATAAIGGVATAISKVKTGIKTIKGLGTEIAGAAGKAKTAAVALGTWTKQAALATATGIKTAAMWTAQKTALVAQAIAQGTVTVAQKAATAAQWLMNAALSANPIGIIVTALAALATGLTLFFTKTETGRKIWSALTTAFTTGWTAISGAFKTGYSTVKSWLQKVWDFIKTVWKFSPLGLITSNWDKITGAFSKGYSTVKGWLQKAWDFIKKMWSFSPVGLITSNWDKITGAFSKGYTTVKGWLQKAWDFIKTVWKYSPLGLITSNWDKITGFFKGFPTKVKTALGGVAEALLSPFKSGFNAIARAWNNTVGKLSFQVPDWVPGMGGKGWSLPKIPMLAQGGIVTRATLAMIGEGREPEAVLPLSKLRALLGGTGPSRQVVYQINVTTLPGGEHEAARKIIQLIKDFERLNGKVISA